MKTNEKAVLLMRTCPTCGAQYDDTWTVCLRDNAYLTLPQAAPQDREKYQALTCLGLANELQSQAATIIGLDLVLLLINHLPMMAMDPVVGSISLGGLPQTVAFIRFIAAIHLAWKVGSLAQMLSQQLQWRASRYVYVAAQLLPTLALGPHLIVGPVSLMIIPHLLFRKVREGLIARIGNEYKTVQSGMYAAAVAVIVHVIFIFLTIFHIGRLR